MAWDPPEQHEQPSDDRVETPRTRRLDRRSMYVLAGAALLAIVLVTGELGGSDDDDRAEPDLRALMREECPVFVTCGIEADTDGPTYTFTLLPDATAAGLRALGVWSGVTGCLESVDFSRIEQTRALDGMVSSANGRSTWTYHPDSGLTVVCA